MKFQEDTHEGELTPIKRSEYIRRVTSRKWNGEHARPYREDPAAYIKNVIAAILKSKAK